MKSHTLVPFRNQIEAFLLRLFRQPANASSRAAPSLALPVVMPMSQQLKTCALHSPEYFLASCAAAFGTSRGGAYKYPS